MESVRIVLDIFARRLPHSIASSRSDRTMLPHVSTVVDPTKSCIIGALRRPTYGTWLRVDQRGVTHDTPLVSHAFIDSTTLPQHRISIA